MLNSHGENTRTCPHSRMLEPTASPASNTTGSMPRSMRCAAAARPTGPAPMTATVWGFWIMAAPIREDIEEGRCVTLTAVFEDIKVFQYADFHAHTAPS